MRDLHLRAVLFLTGTEAQTTDFNMCAASGRPYIIHIIFQWTISKRYNNNLVVSIIYIYIYIYGKHCTYCDPNTHINIIQ